jgi:hypothetical protein
VFLSDRDVTDIPAGIACTNLKTAEKEIRQLQELYSAVRWLRARV